MINLSKFAKMSFTELTSLPNYYIHEIYKLFVIDSIARQKKEEEEAKKRAAEEVNKEKANGNNPYNGIAIQDSSNVQNLRQLLASGGLDGDNLEELMEELEGG